MNRKITQKRLKEIFEYDKYTGIFKYREKLRSRNRFSGRNGKVAGCFSGGRIIICIDYVNYFAHRLAWLYIYGYLPENGLDHKDRVKHHNWIDNLREVSQSCNMRNYGNRKDSTSGVKGVCFDLENNKWCSYITVMSKHKKIGRYDDFDEAVLHRLAAEQCIDWEGCDSSSPAYKYSLENRLIREV